VTELAACLDPATCAEIGGLDLGEVTLHIEGGTADDDRLRPDMTVDSIGLRKPFGPAVLKTALALAPTAGPLLVYDDNVDQVFVVSPHDDPTHLAEHWPWR
jgi:hypothetical protein